MDHDAIHSQILADPHLAKVYAELIRDPTSHVEFTLTDGRLFHKGRQVLAHNSLYIPILLQEYHSGVLGGHSGVLKTLQRVAADWYWVGLRHTVQQFVAGCSTC